MFAAARKPDPVASTIAAICGRDHAAPGVLLDHTRPIHPADAIEEQTRREYLERQARRDPYPSQEFVASLNTGRGMNPEKWRERKARDDRLYEQTEALAVALENTRLSVRGADNVTAIGLLTGAQETLNSFRSICFFPLIAQRDRRPMLNELRYFRKTRRHHGRFMRYAVVTNGPTVPVGSLPPPMLEGETCEKWRKRESEYFELRRRIVDLSGKIRRFATMARQKYKIDVVFRGIEFTVKQRKGDDFFSVHPHANVLYMLQRKLRKSEWDAFLKDASEHFGGWWWKDCGTLKDPNEAIKYCFKPTELQGLEDDQVRWLYEQTYGLKMAQPHGAFRKWRSDTLWTNAKRPDGKEYRRKHRKIVTMEYRNGSELGICSIRKRPGKPRGQSKVLGKPGDPPENLLMGVTMPQRRFSPYAEPCALVMNYTPAPASDCGQDTLDTIELERQEVLPVWYMNGAPDPLVALALGRGQAAAREGEAGKVRPIIFNTRRPTAERSASNASVRGPPTAISPSARDEWRQLGADFSTG